MCFKYHLRSILHSALLSHYLKFVNSKEHGKNNTLAIGVFLLPEKIHVICKFLKHTRMFGKVKFNTFMIKCCKFHIMDFLRDFGGY